MGQIELRASPTETAPLDGETAEHLLQTLAAVYPTALIAAHRADALDTIPHETLDLPQ